MPPKPNDKLSRRILPNGKIQLRWSDPPDGLGNRRWHGPVFDTEAEADAAELDVLHARRHGTHVNPNDKTTVSRLAQIYLAEQAESVDPVTLRMLESNIRTAIDPFTIGGMRVVTVRRNHVLTWKAQLQKARHLKDSTLHARVYLLATLFKYAMQHDQEFPYLRNPVVNIFPENRRRKPRRVVVPVLTEAQGYQLADYMPPYQRALVILQLGCGFRVAEACSLRAENLLDWWGEHPSIEITEQLKSDGSGGALEWGDLKTENSPRIVPAPPGVVEALNAHMTQWAPLGADAGEYEGLLFYSKYAGKLNPYRGGYARTLPVRARKLHTIDETFPLFPRGRATHVLRHTFTSLMLRQTGGDRELVAKLLGHGDAGELLTAVYAHPTADAGERARAAAGELWTGLNRPRLVVHGGGGA
jgi:integrase